MGNRFSIERRTFLECSAEYIRDTKGLLGLFTFVIKIDFILLLQTTGLIPRKGTLDRNTASAVVLATAGLSLSMFSFLQMQSTNKSPNESQRLF